MVRIATRRRELVGGLVIFRGRRLPIDYEGKIGPAVAREHAAGKGAGVEVGKIDVTALAVGAHAERYGDQVDEIAECEDASKFVQRGSVLEELALEGA